MMEQSIIISAIVKYRVIIVITHSMHVLLCR